MAAPCVRYQITPIDPNAHLFEIICTVDDPDPQGQRFALPAWIPGSYMIREFCKNIVSIRASVAGRAVPILQIDKHTWQARAVRGGPLAVTCVVHAWDLSVRAAHLDASHGFFNGSSVFLRVEGREHLPCLVDIRPPVGEGYAKWRVATSLPVARGVKGAARRLGFGLYRAEDYQVLIDHPVEMGDFTHGTFTACGVPHEVVITGRHDCDMDRLLGDLTKICETQIRFFGEPAPFERYVFLVMAVGEGYGGLEHRASTALLCSRNDLPHPGMKETSEAYRTFLGLCSHEYFHAWNVKRIKPAVFVDYDLAAENYTTLLWAFEGFTSYYDDLMLLRAGLISVREYLDLLEKNISNLARTPGRRVQSLADASFNAWTKYYRQDENSPNALVSYYLKGALFALCLDCTLRSKSRGRVSLDEVMCGLWARFGKTGRGVEEGDIRALAEELSGLDLGDFFRRGVELAGELPLEQCLGAMGVGLEMKKKSASPSLGIKLDRAGQGRIAHVFSGGAAARAGLAAGDVLLAIDGLKVSAERLEAMLSRRQAGQRVAIHAFRRDELIATEAVLDAPAADDAGLKLIDKAGAAIRALRKGWLGEPA